MIKQISIKHNAVPYVRCNTATVTMGGKSNLRSVLLVFCQWTLMQMFQYSGRQLGYQMSMSVRPFPYFTNLGITHF